MNSSLRRTARSIGQPLRESLKTSRGCMVVLAALLTLAWNAAPVCSQQAEATQSSAEATVVAEKTTAVLRGEIVTAAGKKVTEKGWLYSSSRTRDEDGGTRSSFNTEGQVAEEFSVTVESGEVVLSLYTPGFAPAWIGPLDVEAKEIRRDLKFTLDRGFSFPVQIRDPDGDPIAGATFFAHPEINDDTHGPNFEHVADNNGNYLFKHAAKTRYKFRVIALGFETLRTKPIKVTADQPLTLTLKPSLPTLGVAKSFDGSPLVNAKIFRKAEIYNGRTMLSGGVGYGDLIGKTDERGYFELDQLQTAARYLMVVEAENRARMLVYDIAAGEDDIELTMPKRRDLRIRIIGDTNRLLHRRDKPFVAVRQHVPITLENPNSRDSIGNDVFVSSSDEGGLALYQGLVSGTLQVIAGQQRQTVDVKEEGMTEVVFRLGTLKKAERND